MQKLKVQSNEFFNHHEIVIKENLGNDVFAFIAIHNTTRGPSMGGLRVKQYHNEELAVSDALRLSEGMSKKNALAGLPIGGGKAVITCHPDSITEDHLKRFADLLNKLDGLYITAEDSGSNTHMMQNIADISNYVTGIDNSICGDPSPFTAKGVILGLKEAIKLKFPDKAPEQLSYLVQGVGNVGSHIVDFLMKIGGKVYVSEINNITLEKVKKKHPTINIIDPDKVYDFAEADILIPCAFGGVLNNDTIPRLRYKIVCGASNNQLLHKFDSQHLHKNQIAYIPDFAVNSGGIIAVCAEYFDWSIQDIDNRISDIQSRIQNILEQSSDLTLDPQTVAEDMANNLLIR